MFDGVVVWEGKLGLVFDGMRDVLGQFGISFDEGMDFLDSGVWTEAGFKTDALGQLIRHCHAADGHADFTEYALSGEHLANVAEEFFHAVTDGAPDKNHVHLFRDGGLTDFLDGDVWRQEHARIAEHFKLAFDELETGVVYRVERGEENFHIF